MLHGLPITNSQNSLIAIFHTNLQTQPLSIPPWILGCPREPTSFSTHVQEAMDALPGSPRTRSPVRQYRPRLLLAALPATALLISKIEANISKKPLTPHQAMQYKPPRETLGLFFLFELFYRRMERDRPGPMGEYKSLQKHIMNGVHVQDNKNSFIKEPFSNKRTSPSKRS